MLSFTASARLTGRSASDGSFDQRSSANQPVNTVMRFSVRVPVLSEQMAVAPPIVSQAAKTWLHKHKSVGYWQDFM